MYKPEKTNKIKILNRNALLGLLVIAIFILGIFCTSIAIFSGNSNNQLNETSKYNSNHSNIANTVTNTNKNMIKNKNTLETVQPTYNKITAAGDSFDTAIDVPMTNGTGIIAQSGSVLGNLDNNTKINLFYEFNVTQPGPI